MREEREGFGELEAQLFVKKGSPGDLTVKDEAQELGSPHRMGQHLGCSHFQIILLNFSLD